MVTRVIVTTDVQVSVPGAGCIRSLVARLRVRAREAATRRALAGLDEHILRDVGATQRDALTQGQPAAPWLHLNLRPPC